MDGDIGTFTLTQETTMFIKPLISLSSNATLPFNFNIQIEQGSTPTDYEPYTGGKPSPSPDYPQEIKTITDSLKVTSCGKNLFDMNKTPYPRTVNGLTITTENGYFIVNGACTRTYASITIDMNFIIPSGTYTISIDAPQNFNIALKIIFLDGSLTDIIIPANSLANTFTTGKISNHYYFFISGLTPGMTIDNAKFKIQLEKKDNATSIEDYIESQIQSKLPEGEFIGKFSDTNKDYVSLEYNKEDGQYHAIVNKYIGKGVLNGTEPGWGTSGTTVSNKNRFANSSMSSLMVAPAKDNEIANIISNKLVSKSAYNTYDNVNGISGNTQGTIYIYYDDIANYTTAEFKNWLSANQNEFYYLLATPYKIDLGPVDMPLSYNEVTNIFTDSDLLPTINAKYYRNFITTVQNLQVNEKALKQELADINTRLTALETAQANVVESEEEANDIQVQ